jgi:hypothetical protein
MRSRRASRGCARPLNCGVRRQLVKGNWTPVGVVAEGQRIDVGGLNLWSCEWLRTDEPEVLLPHPQYQQQEHRFSVYDVRLDGKVVRFAAAEVSPNVYAFYVRQRGLG